MAQSNSGIKGQSSLFALGYRHIRLLSNTGEPLENSTLFVHVAITNKKGGGVSMKHTNFWSRHLQIVSS